MSPNFPIMIPGAPKGKLVAIHAPFDGKEIATVETAGAAVVETALATAYKLYLNRDAWIPLLGRLEILGKTAEIMKSRADELALEAAREGGKPLPDSKVEVARAIDSIKICIETMRTQQGEVIPMNVNASSSGKIAFTRREPIGVVVAASAFNHPLNLIAHQVGPAIAAGCPVIVKPAEATPLSCFRFIQILREAGLPEAWCQAFVTENHEVTERLVTNPRVAFFTFIGNANVGWMLRSKLAPGTRCALEHGGVAPVVVAPDADWEDAVAPIAKGGFYHAGQVCVSVQRVYVHDSIVEKFAKKLADAASKMKIGDPTKPDTEVGPLIRHKETDRIESWVKEAIASGAKLMCGGRRMSDSLFECTVLFNPSSTAKVSNEEIFGPVVCVYSYSDLDDAIHRANSLPFSFQASVFTKNLETALHCYSRLNGSAIMVNEHTAFRVDWMPFTGLRHSGYGIGGIPYSIRDMQIEKMMVIKSKELII